MFRSRMHHMTIAVILSGLVLSACSNWNRTSKGAVIGGGAGAAVGAVVGKTLGNTAAGAIAGAAVGGATGAIIGRNMDRKAQEIADELDDVRSEEHTSELQSRGHLVCRLLLEKKKKYKRTSNTQIIQQ